MTISGTYTQTFAFSFTAVTTARYSGAGGTTQAPPATTPQDRMELSTGSPDDSGGPSPIDGTTPAAPPTGTPATQPTPAAPGRTSRADALMRALDADQNGQVSAEEFTEGALTLLRRAGAMRRHRGHDDDDERGAEQSRRTPRGLERRLERLFDRIDANDDGSVDASELETALAKVSRQRPEGKCGPADSCAPAAPAPDAAGHVTTISTRITFTAVAVRQYTFAAQTDDVPQTTGFVAARA